MTNLQASTSYNNTIVSDVLIGSTLTITKKMTIKANYEMSDYVQGISYHYRFLINNNAAEYKTSVVYRDQDEMIYCAVDFNGMQIKDETKNLIINPGKTFEVISADHDYIELKSTNVSFPFSLTIDCDNRFRTLRDIKSFFPSFNFSPLESEGSNTY
jgi:hypothetical protein